MGYVDIIYWRMASACAIAGLFFFFVTAESLVRGQLKLPAWVFSSFTLVIAVFFLRIFINSLYEFNIGRHDSIDDLVRSFHMLVHWFS